MRHLLIETPDGTFQLGVNESIPASETLAPEIQESVVTEVTETASGLGNEQRDLKIIHNEIVINGWNILCVISLFKFYLCFFREVDVADILCTSLTTFSVHSQNDLMLGFPIMHSFVSIIALMVFINLNLWWDALYQFICTIILLITLATYKTTPSQLSLGARGTLG